MFFYIVVSNRIPQAITGDTGKSRLFYEWQLSSQNVYRLGKKHFSRHR